MSAVTRSPAQPAKAIDRVLDLLPITFRVDWASRVAPDGSVVRATEAAPSRLGWIDLDRPSRLEGIDDVTLLCAAPIDGDVIVLGRRGGPDFLDSELARLGHLLGLAQTISRA